MKTNYLKSSMLGFLLVSVAAVAAAQTKVPAAVKNAFEAKFANATNVKWGKENKNEYEADFTLDSKKYSANFLTDGSWKETEAQISVRDLPPAVASAYKNSYSVSAIKMAAKIELASGKIKYEIEYRERNKTKEIVYDENGKIIKE